MKMCSELCHLCNFTVKNGHSQEKDGGPGALGFDDPHQRPPTSPNIPFENQVKISRLGPSKTMTSQLPYRLSPVRLRNNW